MVRAVSLIPELFCQIYSFREYLKLSVARDLKNKYKRSVLGYVWTMLHPLLMMAVLAVVFSQIMRMNIEDYAIFLFCGLIPWNFFQSTVMMSLNSVKVNHRIFEQIAVPKYIFILSTTFSNLFNLFVALVPLLVLTLIFGRSIPVTLMAFPLVVLPLLFVTIGISLMLAASNVFYDDTQHITEVVMSAVYFLCPVLYHRDLLPQSLVQYITFNPLFGQIEFFRSIMYAGEFPDLMAYTINMIISLLVLSLGLFVFRNSEDKFLYFV